MIRFFILFICNAILGISILIFAKGFFPHKAVLPGLATWTEDSHASLVSAPFDKVIFMVVDALRSDFVYSNASNFHFTQSLIRTGAAVPFTGHASPPTITMPRVKAITTGSVPSFLDLVLNFAESDTSSTLATQDSWLAQLKAKPNGRLVMCGDDTWLRLFPGFFERADGTTSFFVSDFTEVDNNVTRHVPDELLKSDWNGMILHYLGLDHIGHKTGPKGPNMPGKQQEMDGIVQQIYTAMTEHAHLSSSLLILLGDHGMNEAGNHGASSAGEVSTALTFISPKLRGRFPGQPSPAAFQENFRYHDTVDQSDVAPTLAALLGFPIPKNSLGTIIPRLLKMWTNNKDRYHLLYENALQIGEIARATYPEAFEIIKDVAQCRNIEPMSDPQQLACKWTMIQDAHDRSSTYGNTSTSSSITDVQSFLREAQSQLSGTASKYDLNSMLVGAGMLLAATIILGFIGVFNHVKTNTYSCIVFWFTTTVYSITMFASSYVEEEHQFWYWISAAWMVGLSVRGQRFNLSSWWSACSVACILFGVMRRWNQTGQKYAGEADLNNQIMIQNPTLLWSIIAVTYFLVPWRLRRRVSKLGGKHLGLLPAAVTLSAFLFKVAFTSAEAPELLDKVIIMKPFVTFATQFSLLKLARLVFLGLANTTAVIFYLEKPWHSRKRLLIFLETFHDIVSLCLITQSRTTNIPLFLIYHIQVRALRSSKSLQPSEALLTMLFMQYSSFFAFGGTNAISSVDLSNAYNGISGYNVLAVGTLTFVSNWTGPIYWAFATTCVLRANIRNIQRGFSYFGVLTFFSMVHTLAVMVACLALREHLFIWTVFSPKYLYMMAWTFAQHVIVNGIVCGIVMSA